jgi:hypothetical protein
LSETNFYAQQIDHVRRSMGAAPRRHFWWRHRVRTEGWVKHHPPLEDIARRQGEILRQGDIVWGAVVQANYNMFKGGLINYPGNLMYSRDPAMDECPHLLQSAAQNMFSQKGGRGIGGDLQLIADMLQSERGAPIDLRVPLELTEGMQCFVTNVMFERRHLPRGRLDVGLLPILVDPRMCAAIVVPRWHWPAELSAKPSVLIRRV